MEQIIPALRRDSNYADLEKVRAQSEWDDLNQRWKLPRFSVDKRFSLPPAAVPDRSSASIASLAGSSLVGSSSYSRDLDYELRSEERLREKLNESAMSDPATAYFRPGMRTGSAVVGDRRSELISSRNSANLGRDSISPQLPVSPLIRR